MSNGNDDRHSFGIGDILKGLGDLLNVVNDMVDNDMTKKSFSGDMFKSNNSQGLQGKYSYSVKLGLQDKDRKQIAVQPEIIIPQADVFKENDQIMIILEMPAISMENLHYTIHEKTLLIEGIGNRVIYRKEINIGEEITIEQITVTEKNGIFKIVIAKK